MRRSIFAVLALTVLSGCMSASSHHAKVQDDAADRLSVGTVQREIRIGMPSASVVQVLGSPNMVTTDEERREVWVYDKVASDVTYSNSSGYGTLILIGASRDAGAVSTQQRTLTVVVKFDEQGKVRDFAYHSSKF